MKGIVCGGLEETAHRSILKTVSISYLSAAMESDQVELLYYDVISRHCQDKSYVLIQGM